MTRVAQLSVLALALALTGACGDKAKQGPKPAAGGGGVSKPLGTSGGEDDVTARCRATDRRYEVSEYDTSGDGNPDVRKVFLRLGEGTLTRLVLVCRESDVNADGTKDVVRYYTNEGEPLREESDRDFNGQMDQLTIFEEGDILRQEFDSQGDGKIDTKIFYSKGKPLRSERDLKSRSTAERWQPDRWEYYEDDGRVMRMGTDLDGDGKVDRWDRDSAMRRGPDLSGTREATDPA